MNERSIFRWLTGQPLQVAERRVTGTEVVDRQPHPELAQLVQEPVHPRVVGDDPALCDLEHQTLRQAGRSSRERRAAPGPARVTLELAGRDVDRDERVLGLRVHCAPARHLRATCFEHPASQRDDEVGLLCQME